MLKHVSNDTSDLKLLIYTFNMPPWSCFSSSCKASTSLSTSALHVFAGVVFLFILARERDPHLADVLLADDPRDIFLPLIVILLLQGLLLFISKMSVTLRMLFVVSTIYHLDMTGADCQWSGLGFVGYFLVLFTCPHTESSIDIWFYFDESSPLCRANVSVIAILLGQWQTPDPRKPCSL